MEIDWPDWVQLNLERDCDPAVIKQTLLRNAFAIGEIKAMMGAAYPVDPGEIDHERLANIRITKPESGATQYDSDAMQLYTIERFLSDGECDELVGFIKQRLRPSDLTLPSPDKDFRTSSSCDLIHTGSPLVGIVDRRIAATLGIHVAYSDDIQAQQYLPGQQFKPHTDFFEPGTDEFNQYASRMGNRTWTFMIYLSEVESGGGTAFPCLGKTFFPKKGMAVAWNNLRPDGAPNPCTLHSGEPVVKGEKYIITKWFREKCPGMFD